MCARIVNLKKLSWVHQIRNINLSRYELQLITKATSTSTYSGCQEHSDAKRTTPRGSGSRAAAFAEHDNDYKGWLGAGFLVHGKMAVKNTVVRFAPPCGIRVSRQQHLRNMIMLTRVGPGAGNPFLRVGNGCMVSVCAHLEETPKVH